MKFWVISSKIAGYIMLFLGVAVVLAGVVGVWSSEGFTGVQELLSPYNILNWLVTIITLAPGIGLLVLSDKLKNKQNSVG